MTAAPNLPN